MQAMSNVIVVQVYYLCPTFHDVEDVGGWSTKIVVL